MRAGRCPGDGALGVRLLYTSASARRWADSLALLDGLCQHGGVEVQAAVFNAALSARRYTETQRWRGAGEFLRTLQRAYVRADTAAYAGVFGCQVGTGFRWEAVLAMLHCFAAVAAELHVLPATVAVLASAGCSRWAGAAARLQEERRRGIRLSAVTLDAAIRSVRAAHSSRGPLTAGVEDAATVTACAAWQRAWHMFNLAQCWQLEVTATVVRSTLSLLEESALRTWERCLVLSRMALAAGMRLTVVAYNHALSASATGEAWRHSAAQVEALVGRGLEPDDVTFQSKAIPLALGGRWPQASALLTGMRTSAVRPHVRLRGVLLETASAAQPWTATLAALQGLREGGASPVRSTCRALVSSFERARLWEGVLGAHTDMQKVLLAPDAMTYTLSIAAFHDAPRWGLFGELLSAMRRQQVEADSHAWNAASMLTSAHGLHWESACSALAQAESRHMSGTLLQSQGASVAAFCRWHHWVQATELLRSLYQRRRRRCDQITLNAIVSAVAHSQAWQRALAAAEVLQQEGFEADLVTHNAAISAAERGSRWALSIQLLAQLRRARSEADMVTYSTLVSASERAMRWAQALLLLQQHRDLDIRLQAVSCASGVGACCTGGEDCRWQRALALFFGASALDPLIKPDKALCRAMLAECEQLGLADQELMMLKSVGGSGFMR